MRIGAHVSVAGGVWNAFANGEEMGCETLQIFTKNANRWEAKELSLEEAKKFKAERKRTQISPVVAHDSYLINLASEDKELLKKSIAAFVDEVRRAELLGVDFLVTHMGAHLGSGQDKGLKRLAKSLDMVHRRIEGVKVKILLETTAGQGTTLGYRFEHISDVLGMVKDGRRLGVCFDTCHVFASGYDIRDEESYHKTMEEFDRVIGLRKLKVFHANDSKRELGSRVDRHEHIGKGLIGLEAFRLLVNDSRFQNHPLIIETPEAEKMNRMNLEVLRSLRTTIQ
jgi:deoxyribonuclease-4